MKRLIKLSEIHEQVEINGEDVSIYNNPTATEIRDSIQKSTMGSIKGLMTDSDLYIWPAEFDNNQIKQHIKDNFDTGYQFETNGMTYIKIFRNSPIREDEIKMTLLSYYGYLINAIDVQNANLEISNYVSGENESINSFSINFNDFINR